MSSTEELFDTTGNVACDNCGLVDNDATELIQELRDQVDALTHSLAASERKRRQLQREQDQKLKDHPRYESALRVLARWQALCHPKARELTGGERLKKVLERLDGGYSEEELEKAARGFSLKPYVVNGRRSRYGTKVDWRADAELVYRDPKHVDEGKRIAEQEEHYAQVAVPAGADPDHVPIRNGQHALSANGKAAVWYVSKNWQVFPCKSNAKPPATANGLLDATADEGRIIKYWSRCPHANVAIRTGAESGLVVLDVDGEEGIEMLHKLEKKYGELPKTFSVVTPRGGQHFYFAHPGVEIRNTTGIPAPGLDIRGDGGYVLAPPSVVDGRSYEIDDQIPIVAMPKWLVDGLVKYQARRVARVDPSEWENIVRRGVTEGQRNDQLTRLAGKLLQRFTNEPGFVLGIVQNTNRERCSPPLAEIEVERIVNSLMRREGRKVSGAFK